MAKQTSKPSNQDEEVQVKVPDSLRAPAFSNLVNVNASNSEVTLNFVYVNPQDNPNGTLVSRVVLPREMLGRLTDLLVEVAEAAGRGDK